MLHNIIKQTAIHIHTPQRAAARRRSKKGVGATDDRLAINEVRQLFATTDMRSAGASLRLQRRERGILATLLQKRVQGFSRYAGLTPAAYLPALQVLASSVSPHPFACVWDMMQAHGTQPDEACYAERLRLHALHNDSDRLRDALAVWRAMRVDGVVPGRGSHKWFAIVLAKCGRTEESLQIILSAARSDDFDSDAGCALLSCAANLPAARFLLGRMPALEPNAPGTLRALLAVCARSANLAEAEAIFAKINSPTLKCYARFADVFVAQGDTPRVLDILTEMCRVHSCELNSQMLLSIVRSAVNTPADSEQRAAHTQIAWSWYDSGKLHQVPLSVQVLHQMMCLCGADTHRAQMLCRDAREGMLLPSRALRAALHDVYAAAGKTEGFDTDALLPPSYLPVNTPKRE